MKSSLILFCVAFFLSFSLVPLMKRIACRYHILDHPNQRKIHEAPIPLMGGAAVFLSFFLVVGWGLLSMVYGGNSSTFQNIFPSLSTQITQIKKVIPELAAIMTGGVAIFVIGLIDDKTPDGLGYRMKFLVQFLVAAGLVLCDVHTIFLPASFLNAPITVLWIVGITNAFNLLDNMNGLCVGVALIASAIFLCVAIQQGQFFIQSILMVFLGALLGFFPYNFPRASIFLGDSGSLFIGYIMGCLTVVESYVTPESSSLLPVILPLLVLGVPLVDTFTVLTIRLARGIPLFKGDKRHLSHRLVELGMSNTQAVICLYIFTLIIGINSLLLTYTDMFGSAIILIQALFILILLLLLLFMRKKENIV